jgi:hypothetical protein
MLFGCEKPKEIGLEIYQVNIEYPDFTKQPKLECYYCFEPQKRDLFDEPIIMESDIENFDWESQKITLTEEGKRKIHKVEIPLQGLPVAMVLNEKPIYGFWFWNGVSSFGCDRVFTYPKGGVFDLRFGHMKPYGQDPRFDNRIKQYLEEKAKYNKS